jgi:hypothetical protein
VVGICGRYCGDVTYWFGTGLLSGGDLLALLW